MSSLLERVRRSLRGKGPRPASLEEEPPAPNSSPSEVVRRLRRELARIDERYPRKDKHNISVTDGVRPPRHYELDAGGTASHQLSPSKRSSPQHRPSSSKRLIRPLEEGGSVFRHDFGPHLLLEGALAAPRSEAARVRLSPDESQWPRIEPLLALDGGIPKALSTLRPTELAFVDTETTGLSRGAGTVAFMIGVGRLVQSGQGLRLRVEQFVVNELWREAEVLEEVAVAMEGARLMVTFNGRGFDAPILESRALLNRSRLMLPAAHLDLLPWARRLFGARLEDCRLGTIERDVLGMERLDDMPGSEAPAAYARYLSQGDWQQLHGVLEHNLIDVATLAALLWRVADAISDPMGWAEDGEELYAVAKIWSAGANGRLVEACLERALALSRRPSTRRRALALGAQLRRRRGDMPGAKALWERYSDEFPQDDEGWIALAKHYEHVEKDFTAALRAARCARDDFDGALAHRLARLQRRLEGRSI